MYLKPFLAALLIASLATPAAAQPQFKKISPFSHYMGMDPVEMNGKVYLYADDGVNGFEFCEYDGSYVKPVTVLDCDPNFLLYPVATVHNNKVYFEGRTAAGEVGIYEYDGVNPSKLLIPVGTNPVHSNVNFLKAAGDYLYFTDIDSASMHLMGYNLSNNQLKTIDTSTYDFHPPFIFKGKVFFYRMNQSLSAPTFHSFDPVTGLVKSEDPFTIDQPIEYNGTLYFKMRTTAEGNEYYSWTGTGAPKMISNIRPGSSSFALSIVYPERSTTGLYNGELFMSGISSNSSGSFYRFNPQTEQFIPIRTNISWMPTNFAIYRDLLVFSTGPIGRDMYFYNEKGDLAQTNTASLRNINNLISANGQLYFSAMDTVTMQLGIYEFSDPTLGIKEATTQTTVSIYPNPASDELHFKASLSAQQQLSINITDITGKLLYSEKKQYSPANDMTIRISSLTPGVYMYSIKDEQNNTVATGKFEKK